MTGFSAPEWVRALPPEQLAQLAAGKPIWLGNKAFQICRGCRTVIQLNKPLFGSWHLCE